MRSGMFVGGAGKLVKFRINGQLKYKQLTWQSSLYVKPGVGVVCDGRKRCNLRLTDGYSYSWLIKPD